MQSSAEYKKKKRLSYTHDGNVYLHKLAKRDIDVHFGFSE